MIAVLTGDIINSRQVNSEEWLPKLKDYLGYINDHFISLHLYLKKTVSNLGKNIRFKVFYNRYRSLKNKFFFGFIYFYKVFRDVYKPKYLKKNKLNFFSFYKRVTKGFKFKFIDNRYSYRYRRPF